MGLSILIPVYNYPVTSLTEALAQQLSASGSEGEIILLEDGSDLYVAGNRMLQQIPSVGYHQLEKNSGRAAARQQLSQLANFDNLLFLDCDSEIIKANFLSLYFDLVQKHTVLACGGRVYSATPPADEQYMLHWKYGVKRESNTNNSRAFMSNNFLIKKELFDKLDHSILLQGYGHEDSWWGIQFEQLNIQCITINNPVLHAALEKSGVFLAKSENALDNLLMLAKNADGDLISKHIKIFRWYRRLTKMGLAGVFVFFENPFHKYFRKNLLSKKPSLLFFDCYRLTILCQQGKRKSIV